MPVAATLALAAVALAATVAAAAVTASNGSSVSAVATISPNKLSKKSPSPIHLRVSTKIAAAGVASDDPVAKEVIDFDKNGKLSTRGLPTCNPHRIESKSPDVALKECGKSVVGHGKASGLFVGREEEGNPLPPVPFDAKITVFNGVPQRGKPTLLMYAFTESPFLSAFIVPGVVSSYHKQGYGSRFEIAIPKLFGGQARAARLQCQHRQDVQVQAQEAEPDQRHVPGQEEAQGPRHGHLRERRGSQHPDGPELQAEALGHRTRPGAGRGE